jgi:hypothetical protein
MATFVWDPAVRWPPPANILLNYDVVPPDPPSVQTRDAPNVLHTFVPIHDALRVAIVDRDASSPTEEQTPMPKVVIVGELYEQNVQVGGGPMPGGGWGGPVDPGYGRPGGPHPGGGPIYHPGHPDHGLPSQPGHPANRPPGSWGGPVDPGWGSGGGEHPGNRPPGSWGGEYPSGGPVYPGGPTDPGYGQGHPGGGHPGGGPMPGGERPDNSLPELPQGGTDVPEDVYTPAPVPEEIASQVVVTVYDPKTMTYTTKSYPPH